MKILLILIFGVFVGSWISWPGIILLENWNCFFEIVDKSRKEKISLKALLSVSPKFLLKGELDNDASKLRIVSDACFR